MTNPLADLRVLALDCQATGAGPATGHLLEIGWVNTWAAASARVMARSAQSYLVQLPEGAAIPAGVQRVTGISKDIMTRSLPVEDIWRIVSATASKIAASGRMDVCPTVIHYARYEEPFLRYLHTASCRKDGFPLRIICTHEIARRLIPGLPRKGLRAVAGYFGHSVPRHRRSAAHAAATAVIWQHLVRMLGAQHDIEVLDQLTDWLNRTTPETRPARLYPMKPEARLKLPEQPGIYRMRRSNGDLLYIGKARSLKHRVNSYFRQKGAQGEHILEMLSQAAKLDVTLSGSALEAAILESDEIKLHAPPYNIALQKGRRKLLFFSEDLRQHSHRADRIHRIGPLPAGNIAAALTAFGAWHATDRIKSSVVPVGIGHAILGVPEAWGPQPDCLAEGLALFHRRHLPLLKNSCPLRFLTGLGFTLWRRRLAAPQKTEVEALEEADENETLQVNLTPQNEPDWAPEKVVGAVENFVMRSALLIRRSRWLCLLSESSLAWEEQDSKSRSKIVLLFENGAIRRREKLPVAEETPAPPGYAKRMPTRRKTFDLTTYERLRVVTTELRRLVAEKRNIEIRLKPQAALNRRHLADILPWV